MASKRPGHGGYRPGSGQKPKDPVEYDEKFRRKVIRAANKLRREFGMSLEEAVLRLAFLSSTQDAVRASIFKSYADLFKISRTKMEIDDNRPKGPVVYIPKRDEDPALKVVDGGKDK
jgi:hypothetical protein